MERLKPPFSMVLLLTFLLPLTKLLLGTIVIVFEVMATFGTTIPLMMNT
jgi:hypothetical protein